MAYGRKLLQISRNCARWAPVQKAPTTISPKFLSEFQSFYPKLIDTTIARNKYLNESIVKDRIKKISEYHPLNKIPVQGEFLLYIYELMEKPENINEKMLHQAYSVACLIETIQAYFIIQDDVLDRAKMRCNLPCWHLLPDVNPICITDLNLLRHFANEILRQNVDESIYNKLYDVCNEMYLQLEISQQRDYEIQRSRDYSKFTMDDYNLTQTFKASYYCITSVVHMALVLSNKATQESFQLAEDLCTDMGVVFQLNNDYSDYVDTDGSISGKSSTDIPLGKCSFFAIAALKHGNTEQRKIFEENYGSWDPECIKRIRKLYNELNLTKLYKEEMQSRYNTYLQKVNALPEDATPSPDVFLKILDFYRSYADDTSRYYYI
ncbi:unnamed protein product [Parnassius apollo]|uniref:(apollo) hypothetical protein n=1 Tax=Parnassius apollo TaxID=110799 RepID=A0A8S3WXI6_PARAO|nr:unnamed protein product [Parnassius apollo]